MAQEWQIADVMVPVTLYNLDSTLIWQVFVSRNKADGLGALEIRQYIAWS